MNSIDASSFAAVLTWVIAHGYPLMFLAMCAEGPTVTAVATFATTLGYFNPWVVFILSILGDVVPDIIFYVIGFWGRLGLVKRFGHKVGLTDVRIKRIENLTKTHGGKTVAVLKYTPVLAMPGLMLVGAMKMKFSKYLFFVTAVTLQKTVLFMAIGYFFGKAYNIGRYIQYGAMIPLGIVVAYLIIAFLYKKYSSKIVGKIEKI